MSDFKVGDKVMCIDLAYPYWCNVEMVVQSADNDAWVYCSHPKNGVGMFREHELVKVTEEKPASLELQKQELLKQIEQIDKQIADNKLEEQKKLGKKEVEIKLTLNELAWVVANVGTNGVVKTETAMKTDAFLEYIPFTFTSPVVCGDAHYHLYTKLGNLLEQTVKDFN